MLRTVYPHPERRENVRARGELPLGFDREPDRSGRAFGMVIVLAFVVLTASGGWWVMKRTVLPMLAQANAELEAEFTSYRFD